MRTNLLTKTLLLSFFSVSLFAKNMTITPDEAVNKLKEGNIRFQQDKFERRNDMQARREATARGQSPFAVIVGCSDSRVSPEIVFDQGIGDLFIVRVAGNVVGPLEFDSIEFSVFNNGSSLILVLGHENCGAVTAVLNGQARDIKAIAQLISPAVYPVMEKSGTLEQAVKANVKYTVDQLQNSPVFSGLIKEGRLKIMGGYYKLNSGEVEFL